MAYKFNPLTGNLDEYGPILTGTGTVSAAADGTEALPGIAFTNDPNTGIYRPGADQLALSTNGNGRLFIDASGILTHDGAQASFKNGTGVVNFALFGRNTDGRAELTFRDNTGATNNARFVGTSTFLAAETGGSERLRITSAGLVGVGTNSPAAIFSSKPSASSTTAATTFTGDGLFIDCANTTDGNGNYGGAISWSRSASSTTRTAAITNVQTGSDSDVQGLAFLTHASGTSTAPLIEAMRITGTGLVGVGVTDVGSYNSAASNLVIGSTTANSGLTIRSGATGVADRVGSIYFADGTTGNEAYRGYIDYTHSIDALGIGTSGLTRLVIDSSGRLLVGAVSTSSVNRLIVQSSSDAPTGAGTLFIARGDNAPLTTNVLGALRFGGSTHVNSAEISAFRDGGTWTAGSSLPTGLTFSTTSDGQASPTPRLTITSTGQVRLAGAGITFNGDTATANELDDYEEGTWTPTVAGGTTAGTATYSTQVGNYTKVGRQVTLCGSIVYSGGTGTGTLNIANLPFTSANITNNFPVGNCILDSIATAASSQVAITNFPNTTRAAIQSFPIGGGAIVNTSYDADGSIYFQLTYFTS